MFVLLTTLYNETNEERIKEYTKCLDINIKNPDIKEIVIFYEINELEDKMLLLLKEYDVKIIYITKRPTFEDFFKFCNEHYPDNKCIITNSDIYFCYNTGLNLLSNVDLSDKILTITRYNKIDQLKNPNLFQGLYVFNTEHGMLKTQHNNGCSIDTWIFSTPITLDFKCDYGLGVLRCDSSLNYQIKQSKIYKPYNPCLDIISIHEHNGWHPDKYNKIKDVNNNEYTVNEWDKLCKQRGDKYDKVGFCKLAKFQ